MGINQSQLNLEKKLNKINIEWFHEIQSHYQFTFPEDDESSYVIGKGYDIFRK